MNIMTASATEGRPLGLSFDKETAPEETIVRDTEAMSVPECQPGSRIRVLDGVLWITQEGDVNDYLVSAGETFVCTRPGRVVVESLDARSRFVVVPLDRVVKSAA
jgi:hypothetical protein